MVHLVLSSAHVTRDAELGGTGVEQVDKKEQVSRAFRNRGRFHKLNLVCH